MRKSVKGKKVSSTPFQRTKFGCSDSFLPPFIARIGLQGWLEGTDWLFCVINVTYLSIELSRTVLKKKIKAESYTNKSKQINSGSCNSEFNLLLLCLYAVAYGTVVISLHFRVSFWHIMKSNHVSNGVTGKEKATLSIYYKQGTLHLTATCKATYECC